MALLDSCDRRSALGRRDYAIVITLLRLGLRTGEVAALTLEDIDWRAGELVVRGKGPRQDRLPVPAEVGQAIASYLRADGRAASARGVLWRPRLRLPRSPPARSPPRCGGRADGPGCRKWVRTDCGTRSPARWSQPAFH